MEGVGDDGGEKHRQHRQHREVQNGKLPGPLLHGVVQGLAGVAGLNDRHHIAPVVHHGGEEDGPVPQAVGKAGADDLTRFGRLIELLRHGGAVPILHRHVYIVLLADEGHQLTVHQLVEPEVVGVVDLLNLLRLRILNGPLIGEHVQGGANLIEVHVAVGIGGVHVFDVIGVEGGGLLAGEKVEPLILAVHQLPFKDPCHQQVHQH